MCREMARKFTTTTITPFCLSKTAVTPPTTPPSTGTCGNGIVEASEECDDTSSCCVACKLKTGALCTPGTAGSATANPCCTASCSYSASSVGCGARTAAGYFPAYCANG